MKREEKIKNILVLNEAYVKLSVTSQVFCPAGRGGALSHGFEEQSRRGIRRSTIHISMQPNEAKKWWLLERII